MAGAGPRLDPPGDPPLSFGTTLAVIGGSVGSPLLLAFSLTGLIDKLTGTWRGRLFLFACTVVFIDQMFRRFAPKSEAYKKWTHGIESVGKFWTAIILSIVYFLTVSIVSIFMKLFGDDPLDRSLKAEPSFWRKHEDTPLSPHAAARHQF